MSIKIELIIAILAVTVPIVLAIFGAAWVIAQVLGSLCQRVKSVEETISAGLTAAEHRTEAARSEAESKVVAVHGRVNVIEAAHNALAGKLAHLEAEHGIMMLECQRHGKAES